MRSAAAIALVLVCATAAHADKSSDLVKSAKAHFDLQEYAAAEDDLKQAYKLDPKPEILYALAQAQRMAGECDKAIVSYRNFLRTNPRADLAKLAQDNIDTCAAQKPKPPPSPSPSPSPPPPPSPSPSPSPPPPPSPSPSPPVVHGTPWTSNTTGHLLVGAGVLALAGGAYLTLHAQSQLDAVDSAKFYDDFITASKNASNAKTTRTIGIATTAAGAGLVIAGVITYVRRSPHAESPTVAIGPRGEVGIAWGF
jgi:tetratricopeptide (TPR) repeat protein